MSPTDKVRCNIMPIARGYSRVSQPFFLRPHALALLRPRRERPRRRAAEKRDELAAFHRCSHSITSSARANSMGGTVRPSALAVLRLMISSYLVGCSTRRSAGFVP